MINNDILSRVAIWQPNKLPGLTANDLHPPPIFTDHGRYRCLTLAQRPRFGKDIIAAYPRHPETGESIPAIGMGSWLTFAVGIKGVGDKY